LKSLWAGGQVVLFFWDIQRYGRFSNICHGKPLVAYGLLNYAASSIASRQPASHMHNCTEKIAFAALCNKRRRKMSSFQLLTALT
jgi:hypothetical protein